MTSQTFLLLIHLLQHKKKKKKSIQVKSEQTSTLHILFLWKDTIVFHKFWGGAWYRIYKTLNKWKVICVCLEVGRLAEWQMMWKCVIVQTVIWVDQLPVNVEIPHIREATENVTKQQTGLEEI